MAHPAGEEPVTHWKNNSYDPKSGKSRYGAKEKARKEKEGVKKCGYCHSEEHRGKDCPKKPSSSGPKSARVIHCKNCGEAGHMAKKCPKVSPPNLRRTPRRRDRKNSEGGTDRRST
jgi:hypothetical protein